MNARLRKSRKGRVFLRETNRLILYFENNQQGNIATRILVPINAIKMPEKTLITLMSIKFLNPIEENAGHKGSENTHLHLPRYLKNHHRC